MTLRIEKVCEGHGTTIRLIGRVRGEHLEELQALINRSGEKKPALDLEEVGLVDLKVVHFLSDCQNQGLELLHCSPYIHEWISRERQP
jgi:hypothetical protein